MCKVAQIYGLSANEAMKLTDSQVNTMLEYAATAAQQVIQSNPTFQKAVGQQLVFTRRAVRSVIGSDE